MLKEVPNIMADLIRIAMLLDEEKIACFLLAVYDAEINTDIIYESVRLNYYELLHYIWAFEKNNEYQYVTLFDMIIYVNNK